MFHPLAFTKTFAVLAADIIAVTLVPVLCTLLRRKFHSEEANPVMRGLRRLYQPALEAALAHRLVTVVVAARCSWERWPSRVASAASSCRR